MIKKSLRVTLPVFSLTKTCDPSENGAIKRVIPFGKSCKNNSIYYFKITQNDDDDNNFQVNNLDVVTNSDGSLWIEASLFLLSKVEGHIEHKVITTCSGLASDLAFYRQFLDEHQIDYKNFPRNKQHRPTYRFRAFLKSKITSGELAISTASRKMQSIISFYRWLQGNLDFFNPDNPMWIESDRYINLKDSVGRDMYKTIKTTNLSFSIPKSVDPTLIQIHDNGKLTPLSLDEQMNLVDALIKFGNVEMLLIHLLHFIQEQEYKPF